MTFLSFYYNTRCWPRLRSYSFDIPSYLLYVGNTLFIIYTRWNKALHTYLLLSLNVSSKSSQTLWKNNDSKTHNFNNFNFSNFLYKYRKLIYEFINFQLVGLAMVGLGVAVLLKWTTITDIVKSHLPVAPWLFIVVGAIVFIIAFFGCCGAIRESHCMIVTVRELFYLS